MWLCTSRIPLSLETTALPWFQLIPIRQSKTFWNENVYHILADSNKVKNLDWLQDYVSESLVSFRNTKSQASSHWLKRSNPIFVAGLQVMAYPAFS